jgi:NTE family protein
MERPGRFSRQHGRSRNATKRDPIFEPYQFKRAQRIRNTVAALLESLPDDLKDELSAKLLGSIADRKVYNMVHLIYRAKNYEGNSKDYEFSRSSMETHWRAGYHDTVRRYAIPFADRPY